MIRNYGGLQPTPRDDRDIKLGAFTTLPPLSELPDNFTLEGYNIKDQGETDFCTAFATCGASELQEGVRLSPEWCFAKSKEQTGDVDSFGQGIRPALSVHVKFGAPEAKYVPISLENRDPEYLRHIENYPDLDTKPVEHIKKSYVEVTGTYDPFDDIRATIWKYRKEKRAVVTGLVWGWPIDQKFIDTIPDDGEGHCMYCVGWGKIGGVQYLKYVQSSGKNAGDKGVHYIARNVVNHFVPVYNAYTFLDTPPDELRYMIENGIKDKDNWIVQLLKVAISLLKELVKKKP